MVTQQHLDGGSHTTLTWFNFFCWVVLFKCCDFENQGNFAKVILHGWFIFADYTRTDFSNQTKNRSGKNFSHKYNICSKLSDTDDDNYDDVMKVC